MPDDDDDVAVPSDVEHDANGDDDPVAEGEEPLPQKKEVSEKMANSSKFSSLCVALEAVWKAKSSQPVDKRLARVLPPKALAAMANSDPPESIFPIFRLLLPTMDTRMTFVGESKVAEMYSGLLNLSKVSNFLFRATRVRPPVRRRSILILASRNQEREECSLTITTPVW